MLKWLLWAIFGLLLLLFFCKIRIELTSIDGVLTVKLRLLHLIRLTVYPLPKLPQKKKSVKKKPPKPVKEKPPKEKPEKQKVPIPLMDYIQTLNDILPVLGRSIGYWMRHTTINRLWVRAVIHEEDAADTAIKCGQLSAAAQTLYVWCNSRIQIKKFVFNTVPNFVNEQQPINICFHMSASPGAMLWGLVLFLCRGGVTLWRGPLLAQMRKKQPKASPRADKPNKRQHVRKATQQ